MGDALSVHELPTGGWGASCCGGRHKFQSRYAIEAQRTCEVIHLRDYLAQAQAERDEARGLIERLFIMQLNGRLCAIDNACSLCAPMWKQARGILDAQEENDVV